MGRLAEGLKALGYGPEQISVVVLTHMHGDHIGGLTEAGAPAFPNARYVTGRTEYDFWVSPDRVGATLGDESRTFRQLDDGATRAAHRLAAAGVTVGDRVTWWGPTAFDALEVAYGTSQVGAAVAPINPSFTEPEAASALEVLHPRVVIAHPECDESILQYASVVGSTSRLLEEVAKNPAKKFIIATETGIFHQMQKMRPDARLIQAPVEDPGCQCNDCPYMKLNSMEKIRHALETLSPEVTVAEALRAKAQIPLDRMMDLAAGKPVTWPGPFHA